MGFKLGGTNATVPASVENGFLNIHMGQEILQIPIPIKTLKFPQQCNFIVGTKFLLYLINEMYSLILWQDGTGSLLTKKREYLVMNFKIDKNQFPRYKEAIPAGMFLEPKTKHPVMLQYLEGADRRGIIFTEQKPLTICLKDGENKWYIQEIYRRRKYIYPVLEFSEITGLLYVPYVKEKSAIPVKGEYYTAPLFSIF